MYAVWGILTYNILVQAAKLIPFMLTGLFLGIASSKVLDEKIVKKVVIVMLVVSGVALIINNI